MILSSKYKIIEQIGYGAFGEVYMNKYVYK